MPKIGGWGLLKNCTPSLFFSLNIDSVHTLYIDCTLYMDSSLVYNNTT